MRKTAATFPFVLLLSVIMTLASTPAATAIPSEASRRPNVNERLAISTLRDFVRQQRIFRVAALMDEDLDGVGEFGSLGELSGATNLVRHGIGITSPLNPGLLPPVFQSIDILGHATSSGYRFVIYLPDGSVPPTGNPDISGGGAHPNVNPNACELLWCAYAWPVSLGTTGNLAFFVNQNAQILTTIMDVTQYNGPGAVPHYSAAFTAAGMSSPLAVPPYAGVDGNTWIPVP
jgi:hypothetical protein